MANFKNSRPKPYKGCCGMCACKDHDAGLRNKRTLTLAEQRHIVGHEEDVAACGDPRSPVFHADEAFEENVEWLVLDMLHGEMAPYPWPSPTPLRMPLGAVAVYRRA